ncbi:hypothetical protein FCV82_06465 [Vibrio breoganii]|uniref:hypothetical protein n=1 Tax=Vibrio breoganii TaxID=553239 RepID=UPI0002E4AC54|nr:hypothetical protein [Vibrio breoganii]TKF88671.1 hypothetical protein FCV82_06465 [Vibrio breoganii]
MSSMSSEQRREVAEVALADMWQVIYPNLQRHLTPEQKGAIYRHAKNIVTKGVSSTLWDK